MLGPHLVGKDIELRPPTLEDAATYYRWMASPDLSRFIVPPPRIAEGMESIWINDATSSKSQILWAISAGSRHVGFTRIYAIDWVHRKGWSSTWLGEAGAYDHGYGTEAVRLRNDFVFSRTSIEKLHAQVFANNQRAQEWIEALGYRHYGITQRDFLHDDTWHDMWLAEILKADWVARSKTRSG